MHANSHRCDLYLDRRGRLFTFIGQKKHDGPATTLTRAPHPRSPAILGASRGKLEETSEEQQVDTPIVLTVYPRRPFVEQGAGNK